MTVYYVQPPADVKPFVSFRPVRLAYVLNLENRAHNQAPLST